MESEQLTIFSRSKQRVKSELLSEKAEIRSLKSFKGEVAVTGEKSRNKI